MVTIKQAPTLVGVGGEILSLTNLDKVLWPSDGYTKRDLIRYYAAMSAFLVPHLRNRPLTVTRYPDGIYQKGFYQKDCPDYAPAWVKTHPVSSKESGRIINYILAGDVETLVWLANEASIELHPWLSVRDNPDRPDLIVVDLDPAPPARFSDVVEVARAARALFEKLGLTTYPKTSGATGLHIYLPVKPVHSYTVASRFVKWVGEVLKASLPDKVTTERLVRRRSGKVYVDHLQNLPGKTIVAPYSLRPSPGAPVSAPIQWSELEAISPESFTLETIPLRVERLGDLFGELLSAPQDLGEKMRQSGWESILEED